jgi:hypothetical protein
MVFLELKVKKVTMEIRVLKEVMGYLDKLEQ